MFIGLFLSLLLSSNIAFAEETTILSQYTTEDEIVMAVLVLFY